MCCSLTSPAPLKIKNLQYCNTVQETPLSGDLCRENDHTCFDVIYILLKMNKEIGSFIRIKRTLW